MKKLSLVAMFLILFVNLTFAENNEMYGQKVYTGTILASANTNTDPINLASLNPEGFFSAYVTVTGDGTLKVEYEVTNEWKQQTDGSAPTSGFITPAGASDIVTAHTKTSGTSGTDLYQFPAAGEPMFSQWLQLRLTETGGANSVTYTIWLNIQ